jgi:hypothetical protein
MKKVKKKLVGDAKASKLLNGESRIISNVINAKIADCYSLG